MITWMQRHRKYLVVTMWISAIAFIGAGFVGWGQYSYGDKASSVAKVGEVEISMQELQSTYSRLYSQYNQLFQGQFDEAQAKSFGLDKQAMEMLINQALILNLANDYGLIVTDEELRQAIIAETAFHKDGKFDKDIYQKVLKQNNLTIKEFEKDTQQQMLIAKTQSMLALPGNSDLEAATLDATSKMADVIEFKVLSKDMMNVTADETALQAYWKQNSKNYMTVPAFEIEVIEQAPVQSNPDDKSVQEYYENNKHDFRDASDKILALEDAKEQVIKALDAKATKTAALKQYIAFKKGELDASVPVQKMTITEQNNPFNKAIMDEIKTLTNDAPYIKAVQYNDTYLTVKLNQLIAPQEKSFEAAKVQVSADYIEHEKLKKMNELAANSLATFKGNNTATVSLLQSEALQGLTQAETQELVQKLFQKKQKRNSITLNNEKIVLVNILEQKMLEDAKANQGSDVARLKTALFTTGLIKTLRSKYSIEKYVEGL